MLTGRFVAPIRTPKRATTGTSSSVTLAGEIILILLDGSPVCAVTEQSTVSSVIARLETSYSIPARKFSTMSVPIAVRQ